MQAGKLDRLVTIQRKSVTLSESGSQIETWATLALRRWAMIRPVVGLERLGLDQQVAIQQTEFRIRYSPDVADLNPKDRLIFPAMTADSPDPANWKIYDILSVNPIGRNEGISIIAQAKPDQT